jgi:hypothetical protein
MNMSNHLPITDDDRAAWRAGKSGFAATLQETMQATGAAKPAPKEEPPAARSFGRREAAMLVAGLVVAIALIALVGRQSDPQPAQSTQSTAAPAMAPAATQERSTATRAPTAEPSPTPAPTATTAPPTPEPEVIYIEVAPMCDPNVNPLYSVAMEVYGDRRQPLGVVTGVSCDSQAAAQANAVQLAAELKGATP